MEFKLKPILYSQNALEPYMDVKTVKLHYTKHQQAYIDKLNDTLSHYKKFQLYPLEYLVKNYKKFPIVIREDIRNNAGGVLNHEIFWRLMQPPPNKKISGPILTKIKETYGSIEKFKEAFLKNTKNLFGSGWVWLILKDDKLKILNLPNQDNPISLGYYPIMGLDCWEHSYYLKYFNNREKYLDGWWNLLNWSEINKRLETAKNYKNSSKTTTERQFGI